jgi:regulator of replication initiation timing
MNRNWRSHRVDKKNLEDKLKELDEKIAEVSKRLPAHSVKPPIMTELFALEDERDAIRRQLDALEQGEAMQNLNKNKGEE